MAESTGAGTVASKFDLYLIRPSRYDDDGYPLQWYRSMIPSNSLATVSGLVRDAMHRGALPPGIDLAVLERDEANTNVDAAGILKRQKKTGRKAVVFLIGVQTNQFFRAVNLARPLRAAGVPVCIGGFHVSGCISMLSEMPKEMVEAQALGISFFAGEAEEHRMDEVVRDAVSGTFKPIYNYINDTPGLAGQPLPLLERETIERNYSHFSCFDLGRGCPYQCSFCTIINVQGRKSRFRSPDDLEGIVRANAKLGINQFFLTDDNFARNKAWEQHLDRLIELRAKGLKVRLAIQVDTLCHRIPNFVDKCVAAGVDQVFFGLENINSDSLKSAKKPQNRIEEYKTLFLTWKKYSVFTTCGYIIGFPNDTYASIMRDIEIVKRELPVDTLYLNFLTPLPGSEDHRRMLGEGVWMDPDLNKYDLNHRVTHHPRMTDGEWERAFYDAHASFYSWEHMERVMRRMRGFGYNKWMTTINRLLAYRESTRLEGCAKLEGGLVRFRRRRERRPELPLENPLIFYPKYYGRSAFVLAQAAVTYIRLRLLFRKIVNDPTNRAYRDASMVPPSEGDVLVAETRGGAEAVDHRRRVAGSHVPVQAPVASTTSEAIAGSL